MSRVSTDCMGHSRSLGSMINLCRLHCYRGGVFWLVDVPQDRASRRRKELSQEGWVVTHTEFV